MADEDTRERILNAAGVCFSQHGFEKATVRDICRRAKVNVAAVNYHFGDKERLYVETVIHAHRFRIDQVPMPEWPEDTPAEQRLRDFVRIMLTRMIGVHELPWQERLMMREMFQPTGACRELVEDIIRPHHELLLSILAELLPEDVPRHRLNQTAFSVIGQCLLYRFHQPVIEMLVDESELNQHYAPLELAEHVAEFTLNGLRAQWDSPKEPRRRTERSNR